MLKDLNDCYRVLDLEPGASTEEVKNSYRELVKVWHPDRHGNEPKLQSRAQEKLKQINLAYERIRKSEPRGQQRNTAPAREDSDSADRHSKHSGHQPQPNGGTAGRAPPPRYESTQHAGKRSESTPELGIELKVYWATLALACLVLAFLSLPRIFDHVPGEEAARRAKNVYADGKAASDNRRDGVATSLATPETGFSNHKGVKVDLGGLVEFAYANYGGSVVKAYDDAWTPSSVLRDSDTTVEVSMTVLRKGDILTARITRQSGIPALDQSVGTALAKVRKLLPFPEGVTDEQWTFTLRFNLNSKRTPG